MRSPFLIKIVITLGSVFVNKCSTNGCIFRTPVVPADRFGQEYFRPLATPYNSKVCGVVGCEVVVNLPSIGKGGVKFESGYRRIGVAEIDHIDGPLRELTSLRRRDIAAVTSQCIGSGIQMLCKCLTPQISKAIIRFICQCVVKGPVEIDPVAHERLG